MERHGFSFDVASSIKTARYEVTRIRLGDHATEVMGSIRFPGIFVSISFIFGATKFT